MLCPHPHSQSEREEFETEYKQKYERERVLLMEENKKISSELDNVSIFLLCLPHCDYFFLSHKHTQTRSYTYLFLLPIHQACITQVNIQNLMFFLYVVILN